MEATMIAPQIQTRPDAHGSAAPAPAPPVWDATSWRLAGIPDYRGGVVKGVRSRTFTGLTAVVKDLQIEGEFEVDCFAPYWRLLVVLEEVGGHLRARTPGGRSAPTGDVMNAMFFVPPHTPVRAWSDDLRYVRHLTLQFDRDALGSFSERGLPLPLLTEPRLGFFDPRMYGLACLFEAACQRDAAADLQVGDTLTASLMELLAGLEDPELEANVVGGLRPRQLQRVTDHLQEHISDPVTPVELAELLGMSRSHFCRAFKASTGLPPHAWLMSLRVRRARELIMSTDQSLVDIALVTGFSDQPHFTRVFSRFAGMTPGTWRRHWSL
jgi:AraC family transcriptional regulator